MRAVIYARISTQEQSVYSLESQIEECKSFVERLGHELIEVYMEDGESAKDLKRPVIQRLMQDLKKKTFDLVVCWKMDRLTRDTVDGLTLIINIFKKKHNVIFMSVTEDIKTETSDDIMMLTIRLSLAQAEREKIAERASMGQVTRAKTGKRNSSAKPYGYNVGEGLSLTINEEEAEIVKDIYKMYVSGFGREKIARYLNGIPVPSPRGSIWFEVIIGDILKNPVYKGATHYKRKIDPEDKRIIVPNMHEAIIHEDLWQTAQTIRQRRKENDMNQSSHNFAFSTILKCGECGRSYNGKQMMHNARKQNTRHYRCCGKYRQVSCSASDISEIKFTKLFLRFLKDFKIGKEDAARPLEGVDVVKEKKKLEKLIADSRTRRMNYTRAMADSKLSYEDFSALAGEEDAKISKWQDELNQIVQHLPTNQRTRKDIIAVMNNLYKNWEGMTVTEQKISVQHMFHFMVIRKRDKEWKIEAFKLCE